MLVVVYVDDIFLGGTKNGLVTRYVAEVSNKFGLRIDETGGTFLGICLQESSVSMKLSHSTLIVRILSSFGIDDYNPTTLPISHGTTLGVKNERKELEDARPFRKIVGCLMHLCNTTGPDLAYTVRHLSCFMHSLSPQQ